MIRIDEAMSTDGVRIPVRAAFIGLKWLPSLFAVGHNNLNPELTLFGDRLEIKSVKTYEIAFEDIREVGVLKTFGTRNIRLKLSSGLLTHTANVQDDDSFRAVLEFLVERGLHLNGKARKHLSG